MRSNPASWILFAALAAVTTGLAQNQNLDEDFENGLGKFAVESWRGTPPEQLTDAVTHGGRKAVALTGGVGADDVTVLWIKSPAFRLLHRSPALPRPSKRLRPHAPGRPASQRPRRW